MADPWNLANAIRRANQAAQGQGVPVFGADQIDPSAPITAPAWKDPWQRPTQTTEWYDRLQRELQTGRALPQYNSQYQDQSRAAQDALIQQLHAAAQGSMDTAAQQQLRQNVHTAQGQVAGAAAARGNFGGAGAGMRYARQAQGQIGAQGDMAAQVLKLQEQQAAQALLAQMYQQQQGQDVTQANDLAQTALRSQGLMDQYYQGLGSLAQQGAVGQQQFNIDSALAQLGLNAQAGQIAQGWMNAGMGAAGGAAGTLMNMPWDTGSRSGYSTPPMVSADPYGNPNDWFGYSEEK